MEHFGIKNVEDLPNSAELRSVELPQPESEKESAEQLALAEVTQNTPEEKVQDESENDNKNPESAE